MHSLDTLNTLNEEAAAVQAPQPQKKKRRRLKLFVFEGFSPDYTDGLAFALARNEEHAKELIEKAYGCRVGTWGTLVTFSAKKPVARAILGGG